MNPTRRQFHPILFVNGPSLGRRGDAKSRNTRSALIRCRISEKRSTYRQEEEEEESKREQLIAKRQARDRHLADQGNNLVTKTLTSISFSLSNGK
ncbi:hypothetical protein V6Z92_006116 [Aspergillus fumigatus]